PPRPPRVPARRLPEAFGRPVALVLDPLEVLPHLSGAPRRIAGEVGDLIPVRVAGTDQNHRVVRGAAAEGACARIPDAVLLGDKLGIQPLPPRIVVVADEEVPAH